MPNARIRNFSQLSKLHQSAIELKSMGLTYKDIATNLESEFGKPVCLNTINQWFCINGTLKAPYYDYCKHIADESQKIVGSTMNKLYGDAIHTLTVLMYNSSDENIKLKAAQTALQSGHRLKIE